MRQLSEAARCAKLTRQILKANFPGVKFTVRSENYAGGNSVNVWYEDGPKLEDVKKLTEYRLQYGHFDGMTDMYEYSNTNEELPQVKYFFVNREISQELQDKAAEELKAYWQLEEWSDQACYDRTGKWANRLLWDYFKDKSL